ncbi:glycosyl hydrolases family 38 N-terminal domain-containing protein [Russula vinacea]|nr:glycosyl hydrolases family 38 N-terminal domain-containing protein [Russula vinacea]
MAPLSRTRAPDALAQLLRWCKVDQIPHPRSHNNFTGGHFSDVNLSSVLFTHRLDDAKYVQIQRWSAPGISKPTFQEALKQDYQPAKKGESIGPSCITGGFGGDRRVEYIFPPAARKSGTHSFIAEATCNGMFGVPWNGDTIQPPDPNRFFQLASADLVVPNMDAWGLLWDFTTLREIIDTLPGNSTLQNKALTVANAIMNTFYKKDPESIPAARKLADQVFGEKWEERGVGIYDDGPKEAQVWGIGHCHIDTAWLWPYHVTQQKVARSWSTQVDLMDRYPEHRFASSSAQQYKWLEQLYPPLFERVRQKVLEGKFYTIGGSWVENDANMPSGEGLARQLIYGQRYFESRFGARNRVGWLPDSFGLTGALPQILRGAGMDYFFTQKLSWNNVNAFPHSTFNWVGIDGTQVLCHMTPVDTYNAQATAGDISKALTNHKNLESSSSSLLVFGNGDGGGGPLAKMLESLRRLRGTANTSRELPVVHIGRPVDDFYDHLKTSSDAGRKLPNWRGELYLEFHRGTYTSHGSIKKGNRKSEILLRDAEHVAALASIFKGKEYKYPKQTIDDSWEKSMTSSPVPRCSSSLLVSPSAILITAGAVSSSGMVYDDAEKLYAEALSPLLSHSGKLTLFAHNTTPFARRDVRTSDGKEGYVILECGVGGGLVLPSQISAADLSDVTVHSTSGDSFTLANKAVQLTVAGGRITSYSMRELIPQGQTGGLMIFEDHPNYWDAWDVEIHHLEKAQHLKFANVKVVESGPLRAAVETEVKYGKSTIKITISLDGVEAPAPYPFNQIVFSADVDWHERHEFLNSSCHSISTVTWRRMKRPGARPTPDHKNTTWDAAKFEVCGHKRIWYGVAILSESKYGFSCQGNVLRISLLRAATAPDAEQDQGKHEFSWALLPHRGHFLESHVPIAAYLFNSPLHVRSVPNGGAVTATVPLPPFVLFGRDPSVILETIKRGDLDADGKDGPRTLVLRLYEAFGGHASVGLLINVPGVVAAYETNLLEDDAGLEALALERECEGGQQRSSGESVSIRLAFRGFEVKTIKLVLARKGE